MNERQAIQKGYEMTGVYNWDREDTMARKKDFAGYKVVMVYIPADKYSRSQGGGYALLVEKKYRIDRSIANLETRISGLGARKARALANFQEELKDIDSANSKDLDLLAEMKVQREKTE